MESKKLKPIRKLVTQYGSGGTSALITLFSVVSAVLITVLIHTLTEPSEPITLIMLLTPTIASLIIAPLASYFCLKLLSDLVEAEALNEKTVKELREALDTVNKLSGLLPICSFCKEIRDEKGEWQKLEGYIASRSEATFSHGICANCVETEFPEHAQSVSKN